MTPLGESGATSARGATCPQAVAPGQDARGWRSTMTPSWRPEVPLEVHQLLRHGEITKAELIPWGSNYTFCVNLQFQGREGLGVYKPRRGERPLWDFPGGTLYRREV